MLSLNHNNDHKTLFTRHRNIVEPMMITNDMKDTLQSLHTDAVNETVDAVNEAVKES